MVRVRYQMAHGSHGVFTVTVTSTLWQLDCRDALASLIAADLMPMVEAGRKHGELHASRNAAPTDPRLTGRSGAGEGRRITSSNALR